jgi:hypothetical protein
MTLWIIPALYVGLTCLIYLYCRFTYLRTRDHAPHARQVFVHRAVAGQLFISALFIGWLGHELYVLRLISIAWVFVFSAVGMGLLFVAIAFDNKATDAWARDLPLRLLRLQDKKRQASAQASAEREVN